LDLNPPKIKNGDKNEDELINLFKVGGFIITVAKGGKMMICKEYDAKREIEFLGDKKIAESVQFFEVENKRFVTKLKEQTLIFALCGKHWYFVCNEKNAQKPCVFLDENFLI
jgi:hypothetical protein